MDNRRSQIIDIIRREFIGPDPLNIEGMIQDNGEEILSSDPPSIRYIAGILFPQKTKCDSVPDGYEPDKAKDDDSPDSKLQDVPSGGVGEYLMDAEELMNLSNSYQQSAMSMTIAVNSGDSLLGEIKAGTYSVIKEKKEDSGYEHVKYPRKQLIWNNNDKYIPLPDDKKKKNVLDVYDGEKKTDLRFHITYRYKIDNVYIYTFTLENSKVNTSGHFKDEDCYYQVEFSLISKNGFSPIPEKQKLIIDDNDYLSNQMLYRNVKTYGIGHGCAVTWDDKEEIIRKISTSIFPEYEVKPIIPNAIDGISLDMYKMSDIGDKNDIIKELELLCDKYEKWIDGLSYIASSISDKGTATRHISNCKECLNRMRNGIELLKNDEKVLLAFQLMNRAMLLQQLHYNMPLQTWTTDDNNSLVLENAVKIIPKITDKSTWYGDKNRYGKWRPFQLAFVLINLKSMRDRSSSERELVDLIWFPTGGGKTEAYLGLSAYTIFIRRILDKSNSGTTIMMRYTLRLLTSQQYERASSMICACESIRQEKEDLLGTDRISIGLWVGGETSPNTETEARKAYKKLYSGESNINPFVVLKCPWCGAQMGAVNKGKTCETPGYKRIRQGRKEKIVYQCANTKYDCMFSKGNNTLPLYVVDDDIYSVKPTLLLGTVDKFAMLPYRPEAQTIFGIYNGERVTAPDLIIQDELHLISDPLGSMVGHYETVIHELCSYKKDGVHISPKIIASTATISRAAEQCHALYACGENNVKQFPPSGLDAGNSFFAVEDKEADGRKYVGILASGASSVATTTIRLYAALLYAGKAITVSDEKERDAYWTNVGYFNSIRELGQTETWIRADIDEYLHVIYMRRYEDKQEDYKEKRRYIWRDEELTSRVRSDKIPASLQNMNISYPSGDKDKPPVDICLATNMISVGVDVPRLGLMTVSGQPKTTSEYIQATSRVGRNAKSPGLVFTIYNPGKPRDKSHYEHFIPYHSRIYCNVEPTSVTPFAAPLRDRALHALVFALLRLNNNEDGYSDPPRIPSKERLNEIKDIISKRVEEVDADELDETLAHIDWIIKKWKIEEPQKYEDFSSGDVLPLMFPSGTMRNAAWGENRSFPTPTSMRNVDASCEARILESGYYEEDE